jgi:thiol:disulfide interchange protein DsbD
MTADWCVTCLVNERVALDTEAVRRAMRDHDVVYLKGDWTRRDPAITRYLERFDRNGVPLYVFYPAADAASPVVLPQILTPATVVDILTHPEPTQGEPDAQTHALDGRPAADRRGRG